MLIITQRRTAKLVRPPRWPFRVVDPGYGVTGAAHVHTGVPVYQRVNSDVLHAPQIEGSEGTVQWDESLGSYGLVLSSSQSLSFNAMGANFRGTSHQTSVHRVVAIDFATTSFAGMYAYSDTSDAALSTIQRYAEESNIVAYASNEAITGRWGFSSASSFATFSVYRGGTTIYLYKDHSLVQFGTGQTLGTTSGEVNLRINDARLLGFQTAQTFIDHITMDLDARTQVAAKFFNDEGTRWNMYEEYGRTSYHIPDVVAPSVSVGRGLTHSQRGHRVSLVA